MYLLNREILNAFNEDSREIYVKAVFNNEYTIDGDYIKSFTITDSIGNTDALTLGNACSNKLELDMFVPEDFTGLTAAKIEMYIGIEVNGSISYVPLGVFYADNVKSTDNFKSVKITAFDAMLKLNDLGNTYRCGLLSNYVTPINIIKDIALQAGIAVNIPNDPVDTIVRQAEGVLYDSRGTTYKSLCSLGVRNLIPLPRYAHDIEIRFKGLPDDMSYSDVRVVYYNDPQGTSKCSTSTYGGMTFGDYFDWDEGDNIEVYVAGTITPPSVDRPLYLGFHIGTSTFDDVPDVRIEIDVPNSYVNSGNIPNPGTVDFSARTMLGYMAGLMGCNAVINRAGQLTIRRLNLASPISIPADIQFMNGFEQSLENALRIEYLTTGTETNESSAGEVITVGQGSYGFNFENPYIMTESEAQNILDLYNGLYIMPGKVKYRGNPSIDCGDLLLVEDRNGDNQNVLVLSQTLTVTGGFNSTIDCSLKTDSKQDFIATPSTKKVTQKFTDFERKFQETLSKLTGVKGGYVKFVRDNYDNIRAIVICENDIEVKWQEDSQGGKVVTVNSYDRYERMWVWTYNGLGFTRNGGTTYETAITMDGEIAAQFITGRLGSFHELIVEGNAKIANWNIDSSRGSYNGGLYSDNGDYRVFLQGAYSASDTTLENSWVLSTQKKQSGNTYSGTYILHADGSQSWYEPVYVNGDSCFYYSNLRFQNRVSPNAGLDIFNYVHSNVIAQSERYLCQINGRKYYTIKTIQDAICLAGFAHYYESGGWSCPILATRSQGAVYYGYDGDPYGSAVSATLPLEYTRADGSIETWYYTPNAAAMSGYYGSDFGYGIWLGGANTPYEMAHALIDYYYRGDTAIKSKTGLTLESDSDTTVRGGNSVTLKGSYFYLKGGNLVWTGAIGIDEDGKIIHIDSSSLRFKENIKIELDSDLDPTALYNLVVKQFNFKEEYSKNVLKGDRQIGFIAEDVAEIYPNAALYDREGQVSGWNAHIMIPAMLKLIQEQKSDIDELKAQNKELKETLESVLARLDKLEKE